MRLRLVRAGMWTVLAVCRDRGDCELLEFLSNPGQRHEKDADRMLALIDRVAASGPPKNTAISHALQGSVWQFIQGSLRVLWFYGNGRVIVCSHAMPKKGQKTPSQDIARAARMAAEYRAAGGRVEVLTDDPEAE